MSGNTINTINGWLLLDKPFGISSANCLNILKKRLQCILKSKAPKIGHAGTLDPLATGMLPVALGEATKVIPYVISASKKYIFTIKFGLYSESYDLGSKVCIASPLKAMPTREVLQQVSRELIGDHYQTPPKYSAIKINGTRAYKLARNNTEFAIPKRLVSIYNLQLISYKPNLYSATFLAHVSKGTYIRSLVQDIATNSNAKGLVTYLRRIGVSGFSEKHLLLPDFIYNTSVASLGENLLAVAEALDDIPVLNVNENQAEDLLNGRTHLSVKVKDGIYKAMWNSRMISIIEVVGSKFFILRNFNF